MSYRGTAVARFIASVTIGIVLAAAPQAAGAQEVVRIAAGEPEKNAHFIGTKAFAEDFTKRTGLKTEVLNIEQMHLPDIPGALSRGEIGIGNVVTAYDPDGYAETNVMATLSMLATAGEQAKASAAAMSGAMMEYVLLGCPACAAEFFAKDQIFLGSASTSPYALLCREPVLTIADMKGKKFRAGAANFTRWAESVGAIPVTVKGHGIKEALATGEVDCTMSAPTELLGSDLMDVTRSVILGAPGGVFAGLATNTSNSDFWRKLPTEQREVLFDLTPELVADIVLRQADLLASALAAGKKSGIVVVEADAATSAALAKFLNDDVGIIEAELNEKGKVADAGRKLAAARALITKWQGLTNEIGSDSSELAALYRDHIFSKLDPETYGL